MTSVSDPEVVAVSGEPLEAEPTSRRRQVQPWHLLAIAAAGAAVVRAAGPMHDVDAYWHVRLGQQILHGVPIAKAGDSWSFAPVPDHWTTSQWLAEVVMGESQRLLGWQGLLVLRLLFTLLLLGGLWRLTLRGRPSRVGVPVFVVATLGIAVYIEERPQLVSWVLLTVVVGWVFDLRAGRAPDWWKVGLLAVVWANVHGLWILLPALLVVAALMRVLDEGRRDALARRSLLLALVALVGGCLTPLGPRGLWLALSIRQSAKTIIVEWAPTTATSLYAAAMVALLAVIVLSWARSGERVSGGEIAYVAFAALFGFLAFRDVPPAIIMLAPAAAEALTRLTRPTPDRVGEREGRLLNVVALAMVAAVLLVGVVRLATVDPLNPANTPRKIAAYLAAQHRPMRVVDHYNVSGALIAFGGPDVKLAVDGRADRYGPAYLSDYLTMMDVGHGWQKTFDKLDPDAVVASKDTPLVQVLEDRGWSVKVTDGDFLLLLPPAE
jgi:hypothetical protein